MHRIFIAINLPEEIKIELEKLEREIDNLFPQELKRGMIRWVKKENLHLTLLFIGPVRDEELPRINEVIRNTAQKQQPFSLRFEKVQYGPPGKMPPRLIWLDIKRNPEVVHLADELKKEMTQAGILKKIENRVFSPHITLGRIKTFQWRRMDPEERPEIEREVNFEFDVNSVEVMESKLKRTGAEYNILEICSLRERY